MASCPECDKWLANPKKCSCGWTLAEQEGVREHIQCSHEGCAFNAHLRLKTEHGWANVCRPHYDRHFANAAKKWCAEKGLTTKEEMRSYAKTLEFPNLNTDVYF